MVEPHTVTSHKHRWDTPMEYIKYTREEINILEGILDPYPYVKTKDIYRACIKACKMDEKDAAWIFFCACLYTTYISKRKYNLLFHIPLEKVPLYINDKDSVVQVIAKWRLTIAK
jgi:hypothetical protein